MQASRDLDAAVDALRRWGERAAWAGWDPYDGLNSPFAGVLTLGRPFGRRLLTQVVKESPLNLRPLLRIPRERDAKGVALAVSAYARLASAHGDASAATAAFDLAGWLLGRARRRPAGLAWGYHFPVETRFFGYPRESPNAIATAFVAHALMDVRELLGEPELDGSILDVTGFLGDELLATGRRPYFRYLPGERVLVHNANALACSVLARAARLLDEPALAGPAAAALSRTLDAQDEDGSWPYAEHPLGRWTDNFHTGYVLESLAHCSELAPDVAPRLVRGIAFWEGALFLDDGTPRASTTSTFPLDAHSYAQAVETWLAVAPWHPDALERADRVAGLLVRRMLAPDGHAYFEQRRRWTNRVAFVRWTSAAAFRALAGLQLARSRTTAEPVGARLD